MSNAYRTTGLHHNLIVGSFGTWLCGSSSPTLLIISLYKTQGRVFSNKGGLMWTLEAMWDPHMGLMGSTREDHGGTQGIHQRKKFTCCLELFISVFHVLFHML